MTENELNKKIKEREKEWEKQTKPLNLIVKGFIDQIKEFINSLMYMEKARDKNIRKGEEVFWWLKIVVIFFALKGVTYTVWGR